MADEEVEQIDIPPGLTAEQIGVLLREKCEEALAAETADLLVQGYTIDQIEIVERGVRIISTDHGTKVLRLSFTVRGRRPITD